MTKKVKVTYFKPSGKYYTSEIEELPEGISGYYALFVELPKRHRLKSMFMLVQNGEPYNEHGEELEGVTVPIIREPYIVPHLFPPKESWS